ncbi:MAG TPA: phosphatase PAP2 family protein [Thermoanaerobaculia bacterium]|nr:phosphatase PAP2 family protein [Thermoanaerobaculia bacterium]
MTLPRDEGPPVSVAGGSRAGSTGDARQGFLRRGRNARADGLRARPFPYELVALGLFCVAFVGLRAAGLRLDWTAAVYTFRPFVREAPKLLLLGIALQLGYRLVVRLAGGGGVPASIAALRAYLAEIVRPGWWLLWLRLYVAYALVNYVYFWVKVSVPLLHGRLFDPALWRVDRTLHLGLSPNVLMVELFAGTPLVGLLDRWYAIYILTVMWTIAFYACERRSDLRRSFLLSCILLWIAGPALYLSLPALGPVYTDPEVFEEVLVDMPRAVGGQEVLWENYQKVVAGRTGPLRAFNPTRGIAALPSLHVGAHFLFLLWARRFHRPLYAFWALGTLLTFFGSVVSGWHYAVDGYLGILLGLAVYLVARRLEPVEEPAAPCATASSLAGKHGPPRSPATTSS